MLDPHAERLANVRLAATFACRANEQQGRVAVALATLNERCAELARALESGERSPADTAWRSLGAAEALMGELREELDGVADHLRTLHEHSFTI